MAILSLQVRINELDTNLAEQVLKDRNKVAVLDIEADNLKGLVQAFPKQLLCYKAGVRDHTQINAHVR